MGLQTGMAGMVRNGTKERERDGYSRKVGKSEGWEVGINYSPLSRDVQ